MVTGLRMITRSRRFQWFLMLLGFVWGVTMIQMIFVPPVTNRSSDQLREEILALSEKYVRQLASETADTIDGPYAGRLTGYDLKKTMAVLLESLMTRIDYLEHKLDAATGNGTNRLALPPAMAIPLPREPANGSVHLPQRSISNANPNPTPAPSKGPVLAKDLILGAQEDCSLSADEVARFPHCKGKIAWMESHWQTDKCYSLYGVDGSPCSFRLYLSEVENWCPLLPGRSSLFLNGTRSSTNQKLTRRAKWNYDLSGLLVRLKDPVNRADNYAWIRARVTAMWPGWVASAKSLRAKHNETTREQKKVLVHLGLLSRKSGFKIAENSGKGGPLGELVQWSDIIASLYILGHDLQITSEVEQLATVLKESKDDSSPNLTSMTQEPAVTEPLSRQQNSTAAERDLRCNLERLFPMDLIFTDYMGMRYVKKYFRATHRQAPHRTLGKLPTAESQCQSRQELPIDMIYIDIVGLTQFKRRVKAGYGKFSCLLRVIDSFGTEPAFNYEPFAKTHRLKTTWGMQNLQPQQFFTMFPHSPDNSFMGFVVEDHLNGSTAASHLAKKDQGVVYGKAEYMWQGRETYLGVLRKFAEIHGTVFLEDQTKSIVPDYVHNHGIMSGPELHQLLRESKIFIGLGFPYEGPAPLEAIAQGAVFINPKFDPSHDSLNTKFFKGKPTRRKLSSQHPYVEDYIGPPHVRTVNIDDRAAVERVIRQALEDVTAGRVQPYMPYEFTKEGMLQRVNSFIEHQDFCAASPPQWPPQEAVSMTVTKAGQSCQHVCQSKGLICEPSYLARLNTAHSVEQLIGRPCGAVEYQDDNVVYPAYSYDTGTCVLQKQSLLLSCVGEHPQLSRVCPCRTYVKGQTALCEQCLGS